MGELGAGQPITPSPQHAAETLVTMAGLGSKVAAGQPVVIVDGVPVALDAEAIAPWPVLELLVDDFFTYIHPLTPFPHEPTFREAFRQRRDRTDRGFLALLASMVGCLVASFPRPVRLRLKAAEGSKPLFPHASGMIERCRAVALEARGAGFAARADIDVNDAATSYFLGLAAGYSLQWKLCHRFFAETLTFIRELGVYQRPRDEQAILEMSATYGVEDTVHLRPFDHITDQIGKRIFWVMLLGVR